MTYVVGSAEVELVPSAKGFDEKTDALIGNLKVNVRLDPDIAGLRARIAEIRAMDVGVGVDLHDAVARTELDLLTRPREVHVDVAPPASPPGGAAGGAGAAAGGPGGMSPWLIGSLIALAPALIPLAGGLTAVTLGLTAMFGAATIGVGALGLLGLAAVKVDTAFTKKLTPTLNIFKGAVDKLVKANEGSLLTPLKDGVRLLTAILPALTPIIHAASGAIDGLLKLLQGAVKSGAFTRWASGMAAIVGPAITGFGKVFGNITLGVGGMLKAFAPFGKVVLDNLVKATAGFAKIGDSPAFKSFVSWAISQVPLMNDTLKNLFGLIGGVMKALAPWGQFALAFIDSLVGGAKGMDFFNASLKNLQDKMPQFVSMGTKMLVALVNSILKAAPVLVKGITALLGGLVDAIGKALPILAPAIGPGLMKLIGALLSVVPELLPPVLRLLDGLMKTLFTPVSAKLIPEMITTVGKSIAKNAPAIGAAVAQLGPIFANAFLALVGGWGKMIGKPIGDWFSKTLPKFIGDALSNAGQWLLQAGQNLLDGLVQGLIIGVFLVKDLLFTWPAQFVKWLVTSIPVWIKAGVNFLIGLIRGLVTGWIAVTGWFHRLPGVLLNLLVNAPGWLVRTGVDLLTGLSHGITTGWNAVWKWFLNLPKSIHGFVSGAVHWLVDTGMNLISGLQQGIVNAWKGFMGWIHSMIMKIPKGIRDALGIHSPSTVMADIGGNMGKGLFDVGFIPSIRKGMDAAQALLRTRTAGLGAAASTDISAQVNARITGGTSSALGTLAQIRDHLATLVAKTPGASDIARATRIQARMGVAT